MTQEEREKLQDLQKELNDIMNSKWANRSDNMIDKAIKRCIPIHQYDLEGNYLASYESIAYASYKIGVDLSDHMASHNKGQRSQIAGYVWRYEKHDKIDVCLHKQKMKVELYDLDGKLIKSFPTLKQLTQYIYPNNKEGLSFNHLQKCVKNRYVIKKV